MCHRVSQRFSFVWLSLCSETGWIQEGGVEGWEEESTNKWKNNGTLISSLPQRGSCLAEPQSCQAEPLNCLDGWSHLASISNSERKEEAPQRLCVGLAILGYYWESWCPFPSTRASWKLHTPESDLLSKGGGVGWREIMEKGMVPGKFLLLFSPTNLEYRAWIWGTCPYQVPNVSSREGLSLVAKSFFRIPLEDFWVFFQRSEGFFFYFSSYFFY